MNVAPVDRQSKGQMILVHSLNFFDKIARSIEYAPAKQVEDAWPTRRLVGIQPATVFSGECPVNCTVIRSRVLTAAASFVSESRALGLRDWEGCEKIQ